MSRNWEKFTAIYTGRSPLKTYGSLNTLTPYPAKLLLGALTLDAGFDDSKKYNLLYNRTANEIGLIATDRGGIAVSKNNRQRLIYAESFCRHFEIHGRFRVASLTRDGEIWVFGLEEVGSEASKGNDTEEV